MKRLMNKWGRIYRYSRPYYLSVRPTFIGSIASLFDLYNVRPAPKLFLSQEDDFKSLADDFKATGSDIQTAINRLAPEVKALERKQDTQLTY